MLCTFHYWTDVALEAIGEELGHVEGYDVDNGRVRVLINGLKPLEMKLDISLPSGDIKQVELEYEHLEKHCFCCLSLSHEVEDYPSSKARANDRDTRGPHMGISQTRTLERLEADRKREESKKVFRDNKELGKRPHSDTSMHWNRGVSKSIDWTRERKFRFDYGARREQHGSETSSKVRVVPAPRPSARERLTFSRDSESASQMINHSRINGSAQRSEWRPVSQGTRDAIPARSIHSQGTHTPSPRPQREEMSRQVSNSGSRKQSGERSIPSHERRSVLERLSQPGERITLLQDGAPNSASGRLQDVNLHHQEETLPFQSGGSNRASGSKLPSGQDQETHGGITDRSPIRTLSEDRVHVSLRLGPLLNTETTTQNDSPQLVNDQDTGKGKKSKTSVTKKRGSASPT